MPLSHNNTHPVTYLVSCQDPERCHDLLGGVGVSGLSGHKVNERLERDDSCSIRIHQHHYPSKLHLSLGKRCRRIRSRIRKITYDNLHESESASKQ